MRFIIMMTALAVLYGAAFWYIRKNPLGGPKIPTPFLKRVSDEERAINYNEAILKGRGGVRLEEDVSTLHEHPTIICRWSNHPVHRGPRPAVWQRDMSYPVCKGCLHEDPYE